MHDTHTLPTRLVPSVTDADGVSLARQHQRMEDRWRLRAQLAAMGDRRARRDGSWEAVPFARQAGCGRIVVDESAQVRRKDGRHYVTGVMTCGSVWLCAVCEAKIRTRRAVEQRELGKAHAQAGGSVGLLTLTVRHAPGDGLADLIADELDAWKSIQQDDRFRSLRRTRMWRPRKDGRPGEVERWIQVGDEPLIGTARALEVTQGFTTQGPAGSWHPHLHVVFYWRDERDRADQVEWIREAWANRIEARRGARPGVAGFDYRTIPACSVDYVSKISDEITRADLKGKSRSVWALVEHAANGDARAVAAWLEYCAAMKGKRSLHLSHGLRDRYGLGASKSDEELAADDVQGELVQVIEKRELVRLMRCGHGEYPRLVDLLIGLDLRARDNSPPEDAVIPCCVAVP